MEDTPINTDQSVELSPDDLLNNQKIIYELQKTLLEEIRSIKPLPNVVCILWDVENINPGPKSLFVDGLIDFATEIGRVTISRAYGNWSKTTIKNMAKPLNAKGFKTIHISTPQKHKNSADLEMITESIQIAIGRPEISHYVIVASDIDFRSLVTALRQEGKHVTIVYDNKRVNSDLLASADHYVDYRQLLPGVDDEEDDQIPEEKIKGTVIDTASKVDPSIQGLDLEQAFNLLAEAILDMEELNQDTLWGYVKIKMKVLQAGFDEKALGFKKWSDFLKKAVSENVIELDERGSKGTLSLTDSSRVKYSGISVPYKQLVKVLEEMDFIELGDLTQDPAWHPASAVNIKLQNLGFDYKKIGYKQFKKYLLDLQTRDIIEFDSMGLTDYIKRASNSS